MEIKYFETFQLDIAMGLVICDKDTLKNEYRRLAIILHPDKGGSNERFRAMKSEYEYIRDNLDEFKLSAERLKIDLLEKDKPEDDFSEPVTIVLKPQGTLRKHLILLPLILIVIICSIIVASVLSFWVIPVYMAIIDCIRYEQREKILWLVLICYLGIGLWFFFPLGCFIPLGAIGYYFRRRSRHKLPNWKPYKEPIEKIYSEW